MVKIKLNIPYVFSYSINGIPTTLAQEHMCTEKMPENIFSRSYIYIIL